MLILYNYFLQLFNKGEITNFIDDMMQLLIEGQNNIIETFKIIQKSLKDLHRHLINKD